MSENETIRELRARIASLERQLSAGSQRPRYCGIVTPGEGRRDPCIDVRIHTGGYDYEGGPLG